MPRDAAEADPTGFVAGLDGPALIDEVQRAPGLLFAIKESVDLDPRPGRFLLTGSAKILSAPKIYEALTGRVEIVQLWPLSQAEIESTTANFIDSLFAQRPPQLIAAPIGREAFVERVARGGFPEARLRTGRRRDRWFESYLKTTVERDLRELSDARKLEEVPGLLRVLAARAANVFVARNIAGSLRITHETVQTYVTLLETIFLVRMIPSWRPGIGSREIQSPKVYLSDTGLLAHLLGGNERRIARDDQLTGKLLENFVVTELLKHATWAAVDVRQHHYRNRDEEIDIVLESRSGDIAAIEVKAAATVTPRDYSVMTKLRDSRDDSFRAGVVIYTGPRTLPLGDRLWVVPVSALWAP